MTMFMIMGPAGKFDRKGMDAFLGASRRLEAPQVLLRRNADVRAACRGSFFSAGRGNI